MKRRKQRRMLKKRKQMLGLLAMVLSALAAVGLLAYLSRSVENSEAVQIDVVRAALSDEGRQGEALFTANCAACHGQSAAGSKLGPPLIHDIYNPGHHSDEAFYLAAAIGVRQHHWSYGDMPPQPQVSREEVAKIIRYIRELQEANGIVYKAHRM